jgi:hypothetical protein
VSTHDWSSLPDFTGDARERDPKAERVPYSEKANDLLRKAREFLGTLCDIIDKVRDTTISPNERDAHLLFATSVAPSMWADLHTLALARMANHGDWEELRAHMDKMNKDGGPPPPKKAADAADWFEKKMREYGAGGGPKEDDE